MRDNEILVCGLDLLMLLLILFFLAFMSIRYDANKGLDERTYVKVFRVLQETIGNHQSLRFQALLLDDTSLQLHAYDSGQLRHIATFKTAQALFASESLDNSLPCVIYEQYRSPALADVIRTLSMKNIPIGIAKIANEGRQNAPVR